MDRLSWIIQVDPKCYHKGPCKREAGGPESERECDDRSRGRSDAS